MSKADYRANTDDDAGDPRAHLDDINNGSGRLSKRYRRTRSGTAKMDVLPDTLSRAVFNV